MAGTVTREEAYLIVRQTIAISEEGISHHVGSDVSPELRAGDEQIIRKAGALAWPLMSEQQRAWWEGL